MSEASLRGAVKARLDAQGAIIGRVHDYERWANTQEGLLAFFQDPGTKKVFGWEITRPEFFTAKVAMNKWQVTHTFTLRGYYALNDAAATEKTIQGLVDAICLDFATVRIPGTQKDHLPHGTVEPRTFGQYLCHVAEITITVAEVVSAPPEEGDPLTAIGLSYYLKPGDDVADAQDIVTLEGGQP